MAAQALAHQSGIPFAVRGALLPGRVKRVAVGLNDQFSVDQQVDPANTAKVHLRFDPPALGERG